MLRTGHRHSLDSGQTIYGLCIDASQHAVQQLRGCCAEYLQDSVEWHKFLVTCTINLLKMEAIDFQMAASDDLPETSDVDVFWENVHRIKRPGSVECVCNFVDTRSCFAVLNADSECCFSMVRKIDSEDQAHLE